VRVEPKKSTGVDLETASRVESVSFGAVDLPSNVKRKSDSTQVEPKYIFAYLLRNLIGGKIILTYIVYYII